MRWALRRAQVPWVASLAPGWLSGGDTYSHKAVVTLCDGHRGLVFVDERKAFSEKGRYFYDHSLVCVIFLVYFLA